MLKLIAKLISSMSLGLLIIPPLCFLAGIGTLQTVKTLMLIATIIWFITASFNLWNNKAA